MNSTVSCQNNIGNVSPRTKVWMVTRLTIVLLLIYTFQVSASGYAQNVTIIMKNVPLSDVFKSIERQTGFLFFYDKDLIQKTSPINITIRNATLEQALQACLKNEPLTYSIVKNTIVIQSKATHIPDIIRMAEADISFPPPVEIKGRVVNKDGNPLPDVSILISGTRKGTTTNYDGRFTLTVPDNQNIKLEISMVGFQTKNLNVGKLTEFNIILEADVVGLSDVVVVGYGTTRRRDVTGAISSIDMKQISQRSPTNAYEAIQGQMAGVQITTASGAPGAGAAIRIRGVSTFEGGSSPLYILDGGPVDNIDNINPNDIKSIEVLKDGASAAIYGSRSSNGVVIITTKSGQAGKTAINVNYIKGFNTARIMPVATTNQRIRYEQFQVNMPTPLWDTINQMFYNNTNFQKLMYRTAQRDQVNISLSSGTKNSTFYWNTGFENQEGIIRTTKFMRVNSRLNVDHDVNNAIKLGVRLNLSYGQQQNVSQDIDNDLIGQALLTKPSFSAIFDADGSYLTNANSYRGMPNPMREYDLMDVKGRNLRGNIFNYLEIKIIKGLKYTANFGVDYNYARNTQFYPEYVHSMSSNITSTFGSSIAWNWLHESFLNYDKTFGRHKINAVAGVSVQKWSKPGEQVSGLLANNLLPTLNNATVILLGDTYTRDENDHSLASAFGRVSYSYQDKYLLSATVRRDGSSRFGPENKWGNFPAISAGWKINEEPFMKKIGFITDAKVRASYAITGNEQISNRDFDELLTIGNFYNGVNGTGLSTRLANPSIQWEETRQKDIGLDLGLFKGKINFTVDYYIKQTRGLLANRPLPAQTGLNNIRVNLGNVENKGWEFTLQATPFFNTSSSLKWTTNFNFSTNTNTVVRMAGGVPITSTNHITKEGSSLGSFYGYKILGVYAYDESNAYSPRGEQLTPNFKDGQFLNYTLNGQPYNSQVNKITVGGVITKGGDFNWRDMNGDFKIDGLDRIILGNPYPKYFGGFRNEVSYKNLSFSFLFQYQFDFQVYNEFMQWGSQLRANAQTPPPYVLNNFWTGPGDETAIFPGAVKRNQNQLGQDVPTSYWVEDADFIKLSNIKLNYNLPHKFINRLGLTSLSVYTSINNALVWTNYRGADPEVNGDNNNPISAGVDDGRFPRTREFIVGLNVNF